MAVVVGFGCVLNIIYSSRFSTTNMPFILCKISVQKSSSRREPNIPLCQGGWFMFLTTQTNRTNVTCAVMLSVDSVYNNVCYGTSATVAAAHSDYTTIYAEPLLPS